MGVTTFIDLHGGGSEPFCVFCTDEISARGGVFDPADQVTIRNLSRAAFQSRTAGIPSFSQAC